MGNNLIAQIGKKHNVNLAGKWKIVPIMVTKANTCWSPAWDSTGAEHELATVHQMSPRDQMQAPDAVSQMRKLMQYQARFGNELSEILEDNGDD